jgi:hypothetical protein
MVEDGGGRVRLYQGTSEQFIADAVQARLANQLAERFFQEFGYKPGMSKVRAWQNSLGAMAQVLQLGDVREQGVLVDLVRGCRCEPLATEEDQVC